jgi:DNA-binding XRE family transcriptional regulator
MLSTDRIQEVRRLLAQAELSQRTIARMTGVSRATIGAVASGRRPDYQPRVRTDEDDDRPQGPPERCRGCGGLVYMPCRLCRVRAIKAADRERALKERNNPFAEPSRVERDRTGEQITC